jgi:hypothetical protein
METQVHRIPWITATVLVVAAVTVHPQHQHGAAAGKLSDAQKIARVRSAAPPEISTGATNHGLVGHA